MLNGYFNTWPNLIWDLIVQFSGSLVFLIIYIGLLCVFLFTIFLLAQNISKHLAKKYVEYKIIKQAKIQNLKNISNLEGVDLLKEYIKYLERFNKSINYKNIQELLKHQNYESKDIDNILNSIYKQAPLDHNTEKNIKEKINLHIKNLKG